MKCQEKRALVRKIMLLNTTNNAMPAPRTSVSIQCATQEQDYCETKLCQIAYILLNYAPQASTDMCGRQNYAGIYKDIMSNFTTKTSFEGFEFL